MLDARQNRNPLCSERNALAQAADAFERVPIYPILAVNFVGTLGFSIILPFLVFLVT